jgi:CDP-paratose 2-epimerase
MTIFITGICGFVGSQLALAWKAAGTPHRIIGCDNFLRPGSEANRRVLKAHGVDVVHADIRCASDFEQFPRIDWLIDAAANPSVLAGIDGKSSSRQVVEHNLAGTLNMLEFCKQHGAGFTLLSTSRVYSIPTLAGLPVTAVDQAFALDASQPLPPGVTAAGISEDCSTAAPVSLYGATKIASEVLALEYGATYGFPVWINRCGVMAGAGQFGHAEQGIFSFWIHSWLAGRPLRYIGFDGQGHQVRDVLHPADLLPVLDRQMVATTAAPGTRRIYNLAGGASNALSLRQLSDWCAARLGPRPITSVPETRAFDIPWVVLDPARAVADWSFVARPATAVLEEIAAHAEANPGWLDACQPDRFQP